MKIKKFLPVFLMIFLISCTPKGWKVFSEIKEVTALAIDPQGKVWAAQKRYAIIEPLSGETIEWPDIPGIWASGSDQIESMAFDHEGRLWIHTGNIPLAMREISGEWVMQQPKTDADGEEAKSIEQIAIDGQGRVWIRSLSFVGMVDTRNGNKTYSFQKSGCDLPSGLDVDHQGRVWVLCYNSLKMLDESDQWIVQTELSVSPWGAIIIDSNNQVWVGDLDNVQMIWPEQNGKNTLFIMQEIPILLQINKDDYGLENFGMKDFSKLSRIPAR